MRIYRSTYLVVFAGLIVLAAVLYLSGQQQAPKDVVEVTKMTEIAVFETSKGNIEVELYRDKAPATVENFVRYVRAGHYDGTVFHRVIPNFMVQGGGFSASGKEKPTNAPIKLESKNGLSNKNGTLAMARTNVSDSATSQFFINVKDNDFLDYRPGNPGYAVFGKVASGMDIVMGITKVKTSSRGSNDDWPVEDVVIKRAYMTA